MWARIVKFVSHDIIILTVRQTLIIRPLEFVGVGALT